jgi:hypothetical protein
MEKELFYYFIYPGFLFIAVAGGILSWFDRKITAWLQLKKPSCRPKVPKLPFYWHLFFLSLVP